MIIRAFFHLSKQSPEVTRWLTTGMNADSVEVVGISGDEVRIIAWKDGNQKQVTWTGSQLVERFERSAKDSLTVAIVWLLLCFHDVYYDTDVLLHDYVQNECGVRLEQVPFSLVGDYLATQCDHSACEGTPKKSDEVIFHVDKNIAGVILPLSSSKLKDLLFGRLRRIDT